MKMVTRRNIEEDTELDYRTALLIVLCANFMYAVLTLVLDYTIHVNGGLKAVTNMFIRSTPIGRVIDPWAEFDEENYYPMPHRTA